MRILKAQLTFAATLAAFALALPEAHAQAPVLPYIDDTVKISKFLDLGAGFDTYLPGMERGLGDSFGKIRDDHIFFPWKRLAIVENALNPGTLSLGYAYGRTGAILSATVVASADWKKLVELKESLKREREGREVAIKPLPVRRGVYSATVKLPNGLELAAGSNEVENNIPSNEVALTIIMNKKLADLVTIAMHTGAAIGFNYTYDYPAAIVPFQAKISLDWSSILEMVQFNFQLKTSISNLQVEGLTRKLIEKKAIVIEIVGGADFQKEEAAIQEVVKIVIARVLKPTHPDSARDFKPLEAPNPSSGWVSFLASGFGLWNVGVSAAFSIKDTSSLEEVHETIILKSSPYQLFRASAGLQIGGLCEKAPNYFAYQAADGTIRKGCADTVIPDLGQPYTQTPPALTMATEHPSVPSATQPGGTVPAGAGKDMQALLDQLNRQ